MKILFSNLSSSKDIYIGISALKESDIEIHCVYTKLDNIMEYDYRKPLNQLEELLFRITTEEELEQLTSNILSKEVQSLSLEGTHKTQKAIKIPKHRRMKTQSMIWKERWQ